MVNILKKIKTKTYKNNDLINNIDVNPKGSNMLKLNQLINATYNVDVINKLKEIPVRLSMEDSVLGPICLGHMSLATLRKLGIDLRETETGSAISDYDWGLVDKFYNENGW